MHVKNSPKVKSMEATADDCNDQRGDSEYFVSRLHLFKENRINA